MTFFDEFFKKKQRRVDSIWSYEWHATGNDGNEILAGRKSHVEQMCV
jgi:hypothetical protein